MKLRIIKLLLLLAPLGALRQPVAAQAVQTAAPALTLAEVIAQALDHSAAGQQTITNRETSYWNWRGYEANYRPQLGLKGTLPYYVHGIQAVGQPDGTTLFQTVHNNFSETSLSLTQNIGPTGGQVIVGATVQRTDVFNDAAGNFHSYNTQPFTLGIVQPLGQFNALKWARAIEPLRYQESQRAYVEERETVAQRVTELYFDVLLQQVNAAVAGQNAQATAELLRIGRERFALGRLSQSDLLQLELNLLDARQAQNQARLDAESAAVQLQAYTGQPAAAGALALAVPAPAPQPAVAPTQALAEARQFRSTTLALRRRLLQAERDVAQARGTTGFQASLTANLGYVNQARNFTDTYVNLRDQQQVRLAFSLPLVDWGRRQAIVKTAELTRDQTRHDVAQEERSFEQTVLTQAGQQPALAEQIALAGRADSLAQRRYDIARATYLLGRISLTDLTLASVAKDGARRGYIFALRAGWVAYYRLRALTLFDFETQTPLLK
ncbi:TolC family protein [Microvirga sp. STS02]|uniref:TolC family protein n=1 Tax=Hymenobacter negativus TaxID=2795026 RepID=UPI0018DDD30A|nr:MULTISPECIES: TolC family protein [Bacteria]MBH8571423.1 TolC family protein [Hymenobacter negativus]MBR7211163.1 TolC family protein [Microvirga sp. STS02]